MKSQLCNCSLHNFQQKCNTKTHTNILFGTVKSEGIYLPLVTRIVNCTEDELMIAYICYITYACDVGLTKRNRDVDAV